MKRWTLLLALPLALAACRTIVGIDDLQSQPPNGENNRDGGGRNEGDGGNGPPGTDSGCANDQGCIQCCKKRYPKLGPTFESGSGKACMCAPTTPGTCGGGFGACAAECALMGGPLGSDAGPGGKNPCIECVDTAIASDPSSDTGKCVATTCGNDKDCVEGVACVRSCQRP